MDIHLVLCRQMAGIHRSRRSKAPGLITALGARETPQGAATGATAPSAICSSKLIGKSAKRQRVQHVGKTKRFGSDIAVKRARSGRRPWNSAPQDGNPQPKSQTQRSLRRKRKAHEFQAVATVIGGCQLEAAPDRAQASKRREPGILWDVQRSFQPAAGTFARPIIKAANKIFSATNKE